VITCNTNGRSVSEVVADAKRDIASHVNLGNGMQLVFTGAAETQAEAHRNLMASSALALKFGRFGRVAGEVEEDMP
jgi:Cu/Ag efflux pump CusA